MRVNPAGDDDGEIAEFHGHVLDRRKQVLKLVGFQIDLVYAESQVAAGKRSLKYNRIGPVSQFLPFFADDFECACGGYDRDECCVFGRLNGRQVERQAGAGDDRVRAGIESPLD